MKIVFKETTLFRKRFNISQEDLANYLGVSYSALAMYERGERPLATKALTRFAELLMAYEAAEKSAGLVKPALQEKLDEQREEAIKKMQWLITDHGRRIRMLQYKLNRITGKHEGAGGRLHLFNELLAALPKTAATKINRQSLELIYATASQGLLKANEQRLKMQLAIALLEGEVKVYEAEVVRLKEEG